MHLAHTPPTVPTAIDALELARAGAYLGEMEPAPMAIKRLGCRHTVTPKRSPRRNPIAEAFALGGVTPLEYRVKVLQQLAA